MIVKPPKSTKLFTERGIEQERLDSAISARQKMAKIF